MKLAIQINNVIISYDTTVYNCSIDQFNNSYSINIVKISDGSLVLNSVNQTINWNVDVTSLTTTTQSGLTVIELA
jgi:hypothetical protein